MMLQYSNGQKVAHAPVMIKKGMGTIVEAPSSFVSDKKPAENSLLNKSSSSTDMVYVYDAGAQYCFEKVGNGKGDGQDPGRANSPSSNPSMCSVQQGHTPGHQPPRWGLFQKESLVPAHSAAAVRAADGPQHADRPFSDQYRREALGGTLLLRHTPQAGALAHARPFTPDTGRTSDAVVVSGREDGRIFSSSYNKGSTTETETSRLRMQNPRTQTIAAARPFILAAVAAEPGRPPELRVFNSSYHEFATTEAATSHLRRHNPQMERLSRAVPLAKNASPPPPRDGAAAASPAPASQFAQRPSTPNAARHRSSSGEAQLAATSRPVVLGPPSGGDLQYVSSSYNEVSSRPSSANPLRRQTPAMQRLSQVSGAMMGQDPFQRRYPAEQRAAATPSTQSTPGKHFHHLEKSSPFLKKADRGSSAAASPAGRGGAGGPLAVSTPPGRGSRGADPSRARVALFDEEPTPARDYPSPGWSEEEDLAHGILVGGPPTPAGDHRSGGRRGAPAPRVHLAGPAWPRGLAAGGGGAPLRNLRPAVRSVWASWGADTSPRARRRAHVAAGGLGGGRLLLRFAPGAEPRLLELRAAGVRAAAVAVAAGDQRRGGGGGAPAPPPLRLRAAEAVEGAQLLRFNLEGAAAAAAAGGGRGEGAELVVEFEEADGGAPATVFGLACYGRLRGDGDGGGSGDEGGAREQ